MSRFRILSLDGGGIRGAFAASFLAELERQLGTRVGQHFDLVAGTSTGGIIALAVALGEPASRIADLYENLGPRIFARVPPRRLNWWGRCVRWAIDKRLRSTGLKCEDLFQTRYDAVVLRSALEEVFGYRTLLDAKTRVVVPAVNLARGCPIVFKTPHLPGANSRDRDYQVVDIALATAAAPTYFPHATIGTGTAFSDGGLWANNPVLVALAEAARIRGGDATGLAGVEILSLGTGRARYSLVPPDAAGLAWWAPQLIDIMSLAQSEGTMRTAEFLLDRPIERVDFDLPDNTWRLDAIECLERLVHFGRDEAHRRLARLRATVLDAPVEEGDWKGERPVVKAATCTTVVPAAPTQDGLRQSSAVVAGSKSKSSSI